MLAASLSFDFGIQTCHPASDMLSKLAVDKESFQYISSSTISLVWIGDSMSILLDSTTVPVASPPAAPRRQPINDGVDRLPPATPITLSLHVLAVA